MREYYWYNCDLIFYQANENIPRSTVNTVQAKLAELIINFMTAYKNLKTTINQIDVIKNHFAPITKAVEDRYIRKSWARDKFSD